MEHSDPNSYIFLFVDDIRPGVFLCSSMVLGGVFDSSGGFFFELRGASLQEVHCCSKNQLYQTSLAKGGRIGLARQVL